MKLIILDQNGVINQCSHTFIKSPDEWKPIPGSLEAIARLTHLGYRVVIASNQSGIGRGLVDMNTFTAINDKMYKAVNQAGGHIDAIFFCPHTIVDECTCRKPKIGMIDEITQRYCVDIKNVSMIGDSLKDLQAAATVGASPILVLTGKGKKTQSEEILPAGTLVFDNLTKAVDALVGQA